MWNLLRPRQQSTLPKQELQEPQVQQEICKHTWELVAKTFAEPVRPINPAGDPKLVFGVTTLIWNCASCGEFNKEEMLGSDENRWLKIVDDVNKHGMQYIKEGDKTYGVAVWMPELTPDEISKLPRR